MKFPASPPSGKFRPHQRSPISPCKQGGSPQHDIPGVQEKFPRGKSNTEIPDVSVLREPVFGTALDSRRSTHTAARDGGNIGENTGKLPGPVVGEAAQEEARAAPALEPWGDSERNAKIHVSASEILVRCPPGLRPWHRPGRPEQLREMGTEESPEGPQARSWRCHHRQCACHS